MRAGKFEVHLSMSAQDLAVALAGAIMDHDTSLSRAVELGRHAGARPRAPPLRRGSRGCRTADEPEGGDHRLAVRQGHSKRDAALDPQGFGAGKKFTGRKRRILVDTLGLLLGVSASPANIQDR